MEHLGRRRDTLGRQASTGCLRAPALGYNERMAATPLPTVSEANDLADFLAAVPDPVERLLLTERAWTVYEAEEMYLDAASPQGLALLEGPLSNEALGRHPLLALYRAHGSRPREDSLR